MVKYEFTTGNSNIYFSTKQVASLTDDRIHDQARDIPNAMFGFQD